MIRKFPMYGVLVSMAVGSVSLWMGWMNVAIASFLALALSAKSSDWLPEDEDDA